MLLLSPRRELGFYRIEVDPLGSSLEVPMMMAMAIESIESIVQQALETRQLTLSQESQIKSCLLENTFTQQDLVALSTLTNAMVEGAIRR